MFLYYFTEYFKIESLLSPPDSPTPVSFLDNNIYKPTSHYQATSLNKSSNKKPVKKSEKCVPNENSYPHGDKKGYDKVGVLISAGVNYGKVVWEGPLGGLFFYNNNNNRSSVVNKDLIKYND